MLNLRLILQKHLQRLDLSVSIFVNKKAERFVEPIKNAASKMVVVKIQLIMQMWVTVRKEQGSWLDTVKTEDIEYNY